MKKTRRNLRNKKNLRSFNSPHSRRSSKNASKTKNTKNKEKPLKIDENIENNINEESNPSHNEDDEMSTSIDNQNPVYSLFKMIFNVKEAKRNLIFAGFDIKSLPLKKINEALFTDSYKKLTEIENLINDDKMEIKTKANKIFHLSKEYYRLIPHNFNTYNVEKNFEINSISKIQKEICLLELIKSVQELDNEFKSIKEKTQKKKNEKKDGDAERTKEEKDEENNKFGDKKNYDKKDNRIKDFIEKAMESLEYEVSVVSEKSDQYKELKEFLNYYSKGSGGEYPELQLQELFELNSRKKSIKESKGLLLWFGCEISHFFSILKNNFRLPSKEAPKSAFCYGKGICMSLNAFSQAQKCLSRNSSGLLFLCTVNNEKKKEIKEYNINLPDCLHQKYPMINVRNRYVYYLDDDEKDKQKHHFTLDDYIIYDTSKIKIKFIAKISTPDSFPSISYDNVN